MANGARGSYALCTQLGQTTIMLAHRPSRDNDLSHGPVTQRANEVVMMALNALVLGEDDGIELPNYTMADPV